MNTYSNEDGADSDGSNDNDDSNDGSEVSKIEVHETYIDSKMNSKKRKYNQISNYNNAYASNIGMKNVKKRKKNPKKLKNFK